MAKKCKIEGFESLDRLFRQVSRPQEFCEKAVGAAAPILLKSTKRSVRKAIKEPPNARKGESKRTGALERSFMASAPKTNEYGSFSCIQPVGNRTDGKTADKGKPLHYAAQAAFLEWGTSNGQAPSPFRARAVNDAEKECEKTMEKTFLDEVSKHWLVEYD